MMGSELAKLDPDFTLRPGDEIYVAWMDEEGDFRQERFEILEIQENGFRDFALFNDEREFWLRESINMCYIAFGDDLDLDDRRRDLVALGAGRTRSGLRWNAVATMILLNYKPGISVDIIASELTECPTDLYEALRGLPEGDIHARLRELNTRRLR